MQRSHATMLFLFSLFLLFFFFFREFRNVYSWCTVLRLCETRRFQAAVYMYALNSNAFNKGLFPWPLSSCIVDNYSFAEGKRGCFLEKYWEIFGVIIRIDEKLGNCGERGGKEGARWTTLAVRFWIYSVPPSRDLARRCLNRARTIRFPGVNKIVPLPHFREIVYSPLYTETEITVPDIKIYTLLLRLEITGSPCLFPPRSLPLSPAYKLLRVVIRANIFTRNCGNRVKERYTFYQFHFFFSIVFFFRSIIL